VRERELTRAQTETPRAGEPPSGGELLERLSLKETWPSRVSAQANYDEVNLSQVKPTVLELVY
jgi:hypothetical protein